MTVGQFIYLKTGTKYAEVYDVPTIQGTPLGFNSGYVGKIIRLNVAGLGETQTYTELEDKYATKQYFSNKDAALFDFNAINPDETNFGENMGGTSGPSGGTSSGNGSTTFDKIGSIFSGLIGLFGKAKTPTTTTPTVKDPTVKDPTPANNDNPTGISAWVKKNVVLVIIGVVLLVGGIIWAIVASVKADKKDKEFQQKQWENKTNGQLRQFGMVE